MLLAEGVHLSARLTSSGVRCHPKRDADRVFPPADRASVMVGSRSADVAVAGWGSLPQPEAKVSGLERIIEQGTS